MDKHAHMTKNHTALTLFGFGRQTGLDTTSPLLITDATDHDAPDVLNPIWGVLSEKNWEG